MASRTLTPTQASGSDWVSPSNALVNDGSAAEFPGGEPAPSWLRLFDLSNRDLPIDDTVLGFEITLDLLGTGGPGGTNLGQGGLGFARNIDDVPDNAALAFDANAATYYGWASTSTSEARGATVIHDLGQPVTVGRIVSKSIFGDFSSEYHWQYSHDGFTWTDVDYDSVIVAPLPLADFNLDDAIDPVAARWWRFTLGNENPSDVSGTRIYEFRLYGADEVTLLTPGVSVVSSSELERLEIGLSKDGINVEGATKSVTIDPAGGTYSLGGLLDQWGGAWDPADVDDADVSVLIRRGDAVGGGDEATYTARLVDSCTVTIYSDPAGGSLMPREAPLQKSIIGKESPHGTPATPTILLKAMRLNLEPDETSEEFTAQGELIPFQQTQVTDWAQGQLSGYPTYDEIGLALASVIGKPVTSTVTTGVYRHEFIFDPRGQCDPEAFTNEYGDATVAERFTHVLLSALGISTSRTQSPSLSGSAFSRRPEVATLTPGVNAVQSMEITGSPAGGTYKLRFKGAETTALNHNANAAAITSALEALSTIGAGNVVVSSTGPFVITFGSALAGKEQPLVELALNSLTGGSTPTVVLAITTLGGYTEFDCVPIQAGEVSVFYATTRAGLTGGKLTDCFRADWNIAGRMQPVWVQDDALASFKTATEGATSIVASIDVQADAVASQMITDRRANTLKYLRLAYTSKKLIPATAVYHSLTIEMACQINQVGTSSDQQGIYARQFQASARFDDTWGRAATFVLINGTPTY